MPPATDVQSLGLKAQEKNTLRIGLRRSKTMFSHETGIPEDLFELFLEATLEDETETKSDFELWLDDHKQQNGKTSLKDDIELAMRLFNEAEGLTKDDGLSAEDIIVLLQNSDMSNPNNLVRWKGIQVEWLVLRRVCSGMPTLVCSKGMYHRDATAVWY